MSTRKNTLAGKGLARTSIVSGVRGAANNLMGITNPKKQLPMPRSRNGHLVDRSSPDFGSADHIKRGFHNMMFAAGRNRSWLIDMKNWQQLHRGGPHEALVAQQCREFIQQNPHLFRRKGETK